jgi:mannobiose 2-epimerase
MKSPLLFSLVLLGWLTVARAAEVPAVTPQRAGPAEIAEYASQAAAELQGNILPFWLQHTRDPKRGGFYGEIDGKLKVKKEAPRGALLTARVLWTFSAAYARYHAPEYREMARWAYDDLLAHFWDREQGGVYWMVSADGVPVDDRKVAYVQSFAIYGLSEYFRATGEQAALDKAVELYRVLDRHAHDQKHGGYFEEFKRDWTISRQRGRFGSAMGSAGQKSQNTHLHILEALTNLYRAWPDPQLKRDLREVTELMLDRVLDAESGHLHLFLKEDWTPDSAEVSFGHDIEFSWLIMEAVEALRDPALIARAKGEALKIAAVTLKQGVDPDGGVLGEAGPKGLTVTFKEWWPQAEAAVGFLNAYQLGGDTAYLQASRHTWQFIETTLVDHERGEWLQGVSRDGRRKSTLKVGFWKCPYHNGRACLELLSRLEKLRVTP